MFIFIFINKVLTFLRLREVKNETVEPTTPLHEIRPFWDFQLFNIEDRSNWLVDLYYVFWRFFKYNPWGNPRQAYRKLVWFIQRGRRGWADCDTWSLDSYLSGWLPEALTYLKTHKHGIPSGMFEPEDCLTEGDMQGNPSEEGYKVANARWEAIMDKMIAAFEANRRAQEGLYEEELGSYPMDRPSGVSADVWEKVKDDRFKASLALAERDHKLFEEGAALFVKFYNNLWD